MTILDNSDSGATYAEKYEDTCELVKKLFARHLKIYRHPRHSTIYKVKPRIPKLKWRTKKNFRDCGIFTMLHMESYTGEAATKWDCGLVAESTEQSHMLRRLRFKYATKILLHEINVHAGKMFELAKEFDKLPPSEKMSIIFEAVRNRDAHALTTGGGAALGNLVTTIYGCRLCHDSLREGQCDTALDRRLIKKVVCSVCSKEQEVSQKCNSCNVIMGAYFCAECKLFDDEVSKQHFHCDKCNICRVGGAEFFFHCLTCGCCYHKSLFKNHVCHTDIIKGDCVICQERMFESRIQITVGTVPRCGHLMHLRCYLEYINGNGFTCPSCLKSLFNLNRTWARIDDWNYVHAEAIIPGRYVEISCNDCGTRKSVVLHQAHAERCPRCNSYNSRRPSSPK